MTAPPLYRESPEWPSPAGGNAGLWYEKFFNGWDDQFLGNWDRQTDPMAPAAKAAWINLVAQHPVGDRLLLEEHAARLEGRAGSRGGVTFTATTDWRFVTGLGIGHPVENGFAWHHGLGAPYLPGSGVKGIVREWARRWMTGEVAACGTGGADADQILGTPGAAGSVVFLDALPMAPVRLTAEVMSPHHSDYYQTKRSPPGDWCAPIPVPFLTVAAGQAFRFAVMPRAGADGTDAAIAAGWLRAALAVIGAGAKSAAGYGRFTADAAIPEVAAPAMAAAVRQASFTLELVTPAFLAGARQQDEADCDLRTPTLRGQLRWWWRTMHAAHVEVPTLAALEAAIWGDTERASPVRLALTAAGDDVPAQPYAFFKVKDDPSPEFKRQHRLNDRPNNKTTQGIFYLSYGMSEAQRRFRPPGARWRLDLLVRGTRFVPPPEARRVSVDLSAAMVLGQAVAALWLLCRHGGAGSKSRKGLGSLADAEHAGITSIEHCMSMAGELRSACGLGQDPARAATAETSALEDRMTLELALPWRDPWFALDQLGFSVQAFAQAHHHDPAKVALGLPRKIHGPRDDRRLTGQTNWQAPEWLGEKHKYRLCRKLTNMRHAAPVHYHLARAASGELILRVLAFPTQLLPDSATSDKMLCGLLDHLKADMGLRAATRRNNTVVTAVLVEEKTKKGGWKARYGDHVGAVFDTENVPSNAKAGDLLDLIIHAKDMFRCEGAQ